MKLNSGGEESSIFIYHYKFKWFIEPTPKSYEPFFPLLYVRAHKGLWPALKTTRTRTVKAIRLAFNAVTV